MGDGEATSRAMPARRAPASPPWEALPLVAPFLDAASLAAASCVSASWHAAFAADDLWERLCAQHYPSALGLLLSQRPADTGGDRRRCASHSSSPHRRLFALFRSASARSRSLPAPRLALADVAFAVDIFTTDTDGGGGGAKNNALSFLVTPAGDMGDASAGLFLFAVDVRGRRDRDAAIGPGDWRVRWTAVRPGPGRPGDDGDDPPAAILMMDAKVPVARAAGAVSFGGRGEAGVAARLPAPGCGGARLDAEVVLELAELAAGDGRGGEVVVEKVRLGVMCECRFVSVDEGLRYLQHFLL